MPSSDAVEDPNVKQITEMESIAFGRRFNDRPWRGRSPGYRNIFNLGMDWLVVPQNRGTHKGKHVSVSMTCWRWDSDTSGMGLNVTT